MPLCNLSTVRKSFKTFEKVSDHDINFKEVMFVKFDHAEKVIQLNK